LYGNDLGQNFDVNGPTGYIENNRSSHIVMGVNNKIKKDKIVVSGKAHKHIKKDKKRGQSKDSKIN